MKILTKLTFIALIGLTFTGCGTISSLNNSPEFEWLNGGEKVDKGDTPGDICQRCGQNYMFIPNEDQAALKEAERQGFHWGKDQGIAY